MENVLITLIIGGTIAFSMYAMALAYRTSKTRPREEPDEALQDEVTGLREELDSTRRSVAELAERLDFAERMLARREPERLPRPQS